MGHWSGGTESQDCPGRRVRRARRLRGWSGVRPTRCRRRIRHRDGTHDRTGRAVVKARHIDNDTRRSASDDASIRLRADRSGCDPGSPQPPREGRASAPAARALPAAPPAPRRSSQRSPSTTRRCSLTPPSPRIAQPRRFNTSLFTPANITTTSCPAPSSGISSSHRQTYTWAWVLDRTQPRRQRL